ncbi:MAG TPA: hypothetical protein VGS17_00665 [Candidatus Limnocylindria bacterium]|nr:hypothetical protein [Candidatus Limnocylindria bacterium]
MSRSVVVAIGRALVVRADASGGQTVDLAGTGRAMANIEVETDV